MVQTKVGFSDRCDYGAVSQNVLETIGEMVDAPVVAFATAEERATHVHVLGRRKMSQRTVDALVERLLLQLGPDTRPVQLSVLGPELVEDGDQDLASLSIHDLPSSQAPGALAVLPSDAVAYLRVADALIAKAAGHVAMVLDVARESERLRRSSRIDALTEILNRGAIAERLGAEIDRAHRHMRPLSIALIDLDHFKSINDRYGHGIGDKVLREVSASMRRCLRAIDEIGRWGGEEFLAIFPDSSSQAGELAAGRLRAAVAALPIMDQDFHFVPVTASFGVAEMREVQGTGSELVEGLVELADKRLYKAKERGRNQVVCEG